MMESKRYMLFVLALAAGLSIVSCSGGSKSSQETVPLSPDFGVALQPGAVAVTQGSTSSPSMVSITPSHSFSGNVAVAISGLPSGVTSSPSSPFLVAAGNSQAVTFSAANTATLGPVNFTLHGTSGALSHSAGGTMSVNPAADFALTASPGQLSVTQGSSSAPTSVIVTALNSFSGKVTVNVAGLPSGVTTAPALPLQLAPGAAQQLAFTASGSAAPGSASLVIQGTSGSLSHSVNGALQIQAASVPDFSMGLDKAALALQQGASQTTNLSITSMNGFGDNVGVSVSGLPSGVSVSTGSSFSVAAGSKTAVTFSAAKNAAAGRAVVTLTGTDGSLSHTQMASVSVNSDSTTPTFSVAYFDSAQFASLSITLPDQSIRIVNPGVQSTTSALGDLCANIYVFDSAQELKECCSCPVTANGVIRESVNSNLTKNPGNGVPFTAGSVAVIPSVFSSSSPCNPTAVTPVPSLDVWETHIAPKGTGVSLVETLAPSTPLSSAELTEVQSVCGFIVANQSGAGICSCTTD